MSKVKVTFWKMGRLHLLMTKVKAFVDFELSQLHFIFQWYMVSVVHVYNRWSKSEIRCYVDGQMVSGTDMSWLVSTSDVSMS